MYKIAVIGDYDSICGFSALGLEIFEATEPQKAASLLKSLAQRDYGIIYITEIVAEQIEEQIEHYRKSQTPAIIPIPSGNRTTGFGVRNVKKSVEQAVGSDIIFND